MDKFREFLGRKLYGIPMPVIVLVGVAGAWYLAKTLTGSGTAATDTTAATDDTSGLTGGDATPTEQPVMVANTPASTVTDSGTTALGNDSWSHNAQAWLISAHGASIGDAQAAIENYLNGDPLSYAQGQLRDLAVKQFGLPPEGAGGISSVGAYSGPATRQGTPPTTHTVKGASDNTYGELARLYYGRNDAASIRYLQAANRTIASLTVGTKVKIPAWHNPKYYKATSAHRTLTSIAGKNGVATAAILALNPGMKFPVAIGTRVRVA
jgi:hypothetical protein